jgi:hypothetical protein
MSGKLSSLLVVAALAALPAAAAAQAATTVPPRAAPAPAPPGKTYILEQVVTGKLPQPLLDQMKPLKTLRQVEELLKANSVAYGWRKVEMNTTTLQPDALRQIDALPPGEVFVIPTGESLTMNVIVGRR